MNKTPARVLMEEDGIRITMREITTPSGEYPIREIRSASQKVSKPILGPVLLALIGTMILAVAMQTRFWLDIGMAVAVLGFGMFWWLRGTRYVLILNVSGKEVPAWYSQRESQARHALGVVKELVARSAPGDTPE